MAWLSVNKNLTENITKGCPVLDYYGNYFDEEEVYCEGETTHVYTEITLPTGTIEKLLGRRLTHEEGPVEY